LLDSLLQELFRVKAHKMMAGEGVYIWIILALMMNFVMRSSARDFSLVGYLPEWRHEGADFDRLSSHLSHLILFSAEVTPKGDIAGLDRLPRPELMAEARKAASKHGTKLLLCLGGNGRSGGFSVMVRNQKNRHSFLASLSMLMEDYQLDGIDYNWEYPGYRFENDMSEILSDCLDIIEQLLLRMGLGYLEEKEVLKDYEGLASLLRETKLLFKESGRVVTVAYYPDTRQESLLTLVDAHRHVDLLHSMSYDQGGAQHSPRELAEKTITQARTAGLPLEKLTLGVPFYGRDSDRGDWVTYEDLIQQHSDLLPEDDSVVKVVMEKGDLKERKIIGFNGEETLKWKAELAFGNGLAGLMIWEVGQDCRVNPVVRGDTTHVRTCPGQGEERSLLHVLASTRLKLLGDAQEKDEL